jgi:hypothetical protein
MGRQAARTGHAGPWVVAPAPRGRRAEARTLLRAARADLDRIFAFGWADEARVELHILGEPVVWPEEPGRDEVLARGRRMASLAAAGLSEEEIAMQLYMAPVIVGLYLLRSSEAAVRIAASNGSPQ